MRYEAGVTGKEVVDRSGSRAVAVYGVHLPAAILSGLLLAFLLLVPSINLMPGEGHVATEAGLYNGKRLFQLLILLANGLLVLGVPSLRAGWLEAWCALPRVARYVLGGLVGIGCVSALGAPEPRYALLEVFHYVLLFALALSVAYLYRRYAAGSRLLVGGVAGSMLLYLLGVSVGYVMYQAGISGVVWPESFIGFTHIRFFNQFQTWTLPLAVLPFLLYAGRARSARVALLMLAACWWMLLFASGGRGTLLSVGAALVVTGLAVGRPALPWLRRQAVALVVGAGLYLLCFELLAGSSAALLDRDLTSDSARFILWQYAWELIRQHPLLGVGPMHYAYLPAHGLSAHPHNLVLQWAAEWGVPALLMLVLLAGWGLVAWIGYVRKAEAGPVPGSVHLRVALTAAALGAAAHAQLSGIVVMPLSQVMLAVVGGGMLAMYRELPGRQPARPRRRAGAWLALGLGTAMLLVAWGVAPDVGRLAERSEQYVQETAPHGTHHVLWPRYWHQGLLKYQKK